MSKIQDYIQKHNLQPIIDGLTNDPAIKDLESQFHAGATSINFADALNNAIALAITLIESNHITDPKASLIATEVGAILLAELSSKHDKLKVSLKCPIGQFLLSVANIFNKHKSTPPAHTDTPITTPLPA